MQNEQNKSIEEKRLAAQRALEGEDRKREREEEERRKREEEEKRRREEAARKAEEERKVKEAKEKAQKEKEEKERREKEAAVKEAKLKEEEKVKKEAFLKKIQPKGVPQKKTIEEEPEIKRVSTGKEGGADSKVPRIRTFKNDAAEAIKKQKQSLTKIAIAEKTKKKERREGKETAT